MPDPLLDLRLRAAVARQVRIAPDDVTGDLDLTTDLGLTEDSRAQWLSTMGRVLDVSFPDDFLDGVRTYADLSFAVRVSLGP